MLSEVHQDAGRSRRTDASSGSQSWQSRSIYRAHRRVRGDFERQRGETAVNPAGGRWLFLPMKIHVSPFLCASSAPHRRNHDDWSCSESAAQPPRRKDPPPPHEYVDLLSAQRLGGTSHYEGSTFDRGELNPVFTDSFRSSNCPFFPPGFLGGNITMKFKRLLH